MSMIRLDRIENTEEPATTTKTNEGEGAMLEPVRRDNGMLRRDDTDAVAEHLNSRIQRVSGQSVTEIDRVIAELTQVRDMLKKESDRVQREISGYSSLSQSAMTSMKLIADSISQWRPATKPEIRRT